MPVPLLRPQLRSTTADLCHAAPRASHMESSPLTATRSRRRLRRFRPVHGERKRKAALRDEQGRGNGMKGQRNRWQRNGEREGDCIPLPNIPLPNIPLPNIPLPNIPLPSIPLTSFSCRGGYPLRIAEPAHSCTPTRRFVDVIIGRR